MLTFEETRWTLNFLKILSISNILPILVDVKSGKIQRQSNRVKVFIWKILFGVGVSHWLYMLGRLVQMTILEPEKYFRWDHFVMHFPCICGFAVCQFTGFCLFVKNTGENVIILNQFFSEREDPVQKMIDQEQELQIKMESESGNGNRNKGDKKRTQYGASRLVSTSSREPNEHGGYQNEVLHNQTGSEVGPRPLLTWPPQYSLNELIAKLFPFWAVPTTFFAVLVLATDPTRPQLSYSSLPPEYQNVYSFLVLLVHEAICMAVVCFTGGFSVVNQAMFFEKCQLEFKRLSLQLRHLREKFQSRALGGRDIQAEIWILYQILKEMREVVVLIELFNRCFPFPIFAWKICCLFISVISYFFVIRHHEDFPFLGLFIGYVAIVMTFMYAILYRDAFSIPGKMDELKAEFLLTAQKTTSTSNANGNNKILWAKMKREIKRIHGVGIKVGSFNIMERESTPNFFDFVLRNVVSLLVTIPR